jgi:hypothetical protein
MADVVICDPPYDVQTHQGHDVDLRDWGGIDLEPTDPAELAPALLARCQRWCLCFCSVEMLGAYREAVGDLYVRGGAWAKTNPAPQFTGDRPGQWGEGIAIMHGEREWGRMHWNCGGHAGLWAHPVARGDERITQTSKPVALMVDLVASFSVPGELVWDPFAGGGTTGVAALRTGRRFMGHEINEALAAQAAERLEAEARGLSLPAAKAGQQALWR